ncbi:MAG: hypothetical protein LBL28_08300 [Treponema sp.]|jgi:hypothetical protein|nr:hypothetical protein [Treponema sp.]
MKKQRRLLLVFGTILLIFPPVSARPAPLNSMSLNGTAGLYTVPSGYIGWNKRAQVGLDLGTSYNFFSGNPIAKIGLSLFNWVEINGTVDFQPRTHDTANTDGILGLKLQLPTEKTGVALGGNVQFLTHQDNYTTAGQLYTAVTYRGEFFTWPAETSLTLGYTFREGDNDNIDFGMGFDLLLVPDVFKDFVHWVVDFSNFSYSDQALGTNAWYRGCLNTGIRVDISAIPALNKFKFVLDFTLLDILDGDRTIGIGFLFGIPLK